MFSHKNEIANSTEMLRVKVFSPSKVYFEDSAISVSAVNDTGEFDVLPSHHNFITLLNPCNIVISLPNNKKKIIEINNGVMHVKMDIMTVFLDI